MYLKILLVAAKDSNQDSSQYGDAGPMSDLHDSSVKSNSSHVGGTDHQEILRPGITTDSQAEQSQRVSSLELENQLLRNEVASLNQEVTSALKRAKEAEEGNINISVTWSGI